MSQAQKHERITPHTALKLSGEVQFTGHARQSAASRGTLHCTLHSKGECTRAGTWSREYRGAVTGSVLQVVRPLTPLQRLVRECRRRAFGGRKM